MTEWERKQRVRKEQKLKDRLREDLPSVPGPDFEELWKYFKQKGRIDQLVDAPDRWYEDLITDAELITEYQQHKSMETGYVGVRPGPQPGQPVQLPPTAKLSEYEEEYAAALSAYYALAAGARPEVERLRDKILPDDLLKREEANRLVTSTAAALLEHEEFERWGIPLLDHEAEVLEEKPGRACYRATVSVSPPGVELPVEHVRLRRPALRPLYYVDERDCINWVSVLGGSLLSEVRAVSDSLASRYGWEEAEATQFLLTGELPFIPPLTGRSGGKYITLRAAPYVSAKTVGRFYLQLQHEIRLGRSRQHTARGARVLRFVLEQMIAEGKLPSWTELTRRWNKTHPGQERYGSRDGLKKAYERARKEIIEPHWTLGDYQYLPSTVTGLPLQGAPDASS